MQVSESGPRSRSEKDGTANLLQHFLPSCVGRDNVEFDLHVGLEREQVRHAEDARVDGSRVLDLEGPADGAALQPENVYLLHAS